METNKSGLLSAINKYKFIILIVVAALIGGGVYMYINDKDTLSFENQSPIRLYMGNTEQLKISSKKGRSYVASDLVYEVQSENQAVIVDEYGTLKANQAGSAVVTCKLAKGRCEPASIDAVIEQDELSIEEGSSLSMTYGDTHKLTIKSKSGHEYTSDELTFSSTNSNAVKLSETGKLKAVGEGTSYITVNAKNGVAKAAYMTVTSKLKKVSIKNGKMIKNPSGSKVAPLKLTVGKGQNYYIYLKSKSSKSKDCAFYLKSGKTKTMNMPLGKYTLYYATGQTWYGKKFKFGNETRMYKADKTLNFHISGNRYMGHRIKLYSVKNGNMGSSMVGNGDFPS